jgi:Tfp pilus assembly protein PilZ
MDKYWIDKDGKVEWCVDPCKKKRNVRFPLCLAIKYHDDVPFICADFLLDASKGKIFVKTDSPLPVGSEVILHFYIPPDKKLLGKFRGKVIEPQKPNSDVKGNYIKIRDFIHLKLDRLEQYLEEKRHLVDDVM